MESSGSRYSGRRVSAANKQLTRRIPDDHLCSRSLSGAPLVLTLEDLEQTRDPRESAPQQRNATFSSGDALRTGRHKAESLRNTEQESRKPRGGRNLLPEQDAPPSSQNQWSRAEPKLMFDAHSYESALGSRTSRILELEEQVTSLEAESEAREEALKVAEDKLVETLHKMSEKEQVVQRFREELKKLKTELYESDKLCKRAEKQRNEALLNAEELTRAFQQYKRNVAEKLTSVKTEGDLTNKNLQICKREREELLEKCKHLESDLGDVREHFRNLSSEAASEKEKQKSLEGKNLELISLLTQSDHRVLRLEGDLENKEQVLRDNIALLQENKELKERLAEPREEVTAVSHLQKDASDLVGKNLSENRNKLEPDDDEGLVAELRSKLSRKEAENQELQAKLLNANLSYTLDTEPVKLTFQQSEVEKLRELESLSKRLQDDNQRLTDSVRELKRKLSRTQAETANTKLSMAQRTSQFQLIQEELLEKASRTSKLEQELTKKSVKIVSIQKLLEEKTEACARAAARNSELEEELLDFKAQISHLEENITKEHREVLLAFEKSKNLQLDQHNELQNQIEHLNRQLEMKGLEVAEKDFTITKLQQEAASGRLRLQSLDHALEEARKELELHRAGAAARMKELENQLEVEAMKVEHLESALTLCKKDLGLYLQQLEENGERFEIQIKKKSEEVHCLQKEVKSKAQSLQETSEENVRLQQTLQQQQQMLQQETARIGDLEDAQTELEEQVSKLEFELEKLRSSSRVEMEAAEEQLRAANKELTCKAQRVLELSDAVRRTKADLDLCKEKLSQTEGRLMAAAADGESKSDKLAQVELMLQTTQIDLSDKTQLVTLLQERAAIADNDLRKQGETELELQRLHNELQDNTKLVEELQEALTQTHLSVEEKDVIIQTLREELRTCKAEVEERDHELLDLDQALKDRNWELKQRAAQLTQLDMSIREHREELQQNVIQLEGSLRKSELETKELMKQVSTLDEKLQEARNHLREKDFEMLQKDQHITRLQKENEKNRRLVTEVEQTLREQQREGAELAQQVRLAREGSQVSQQGLVESRQQLATAQEGSERLRHKLEAAERLSRQELQEVRRGLDDAQDTIANLKTELEARNEVIKATNEVLILKESEVTRLKARISGYERSLALRHLPDPSSAPPDVFGACRALESYRLPESSDFSWNTRRSLSDLSLSDVSSVDFTTKTDAVKNSVPSGPPITRMTCEQDVHAPSDNFNETSFNPLEYSADHSEAACDSPDLGTLSGMLKYIKEEMKLTEGRPAA